MNDNNLENRSSNLSRKSNHLLDTNSKIIGNDYINTPSSSITRKLTYSQKEKILEVELKTGRTYQYLSFSLSEWKKYKAHIQAGESSGQYYNFEVRDKYDYREVLL